MSFELSFSSEFFFAEGEPETVGSIYRPVSVWAAIHALAEFQPEVWAEIADEVFGVEVEHLTPELVLEKIRETNSCEDLTPPVSVYIDEDGWYSVDVYEAPSEDQILRHVGLGDEYTLLTWDTYKRDYSGKDILGYCLKRGEEVLFEGEDFSASPIHAIDSDEVLRGMIALIVYPDVDSRPEHLTGEQEEWLRSDSESLIEWALPACSFVDLDD